MTNNSYVARFRRDQMPSDTNKDKWKICLKNTSFKKIIVFNFN